MPNTNSNSNLDTSTESADEYLYFESIDGTEYVVAAADEERFRRIVLGKRYRPEIWRTTCAEATENIAYHVEVNCLSLVDADGDPMEGECDIWSDNPDDFGENMAHEHEVLVDWWWYGVMRPEEDAFFFDFGWQDSVAYIGGAEAAAATAEMLDKVEAKELADKLEEELADKREKELAGVMAEYDASMQAKWDDLTSWMYDER